LQRHFLLLGRGQFILPSSHRHCYQYLNGAKLRLSDLHNYDSRCRCSLSSYPGPRPTIYTIHIKLCVQQLCNTTVHNTVQYCCCCCWTYKTFEVSPCIDHWMRRRSLRNKMWSLRRRRSLR